MYSERFEKVKKYYQDGFWSIDRVRNAVGRWITEEEFYEITGEHFDAN